MGCPLFISPMTVVTSMPFSQSKNVRLLNVNQGPATIFKEAYEGKTTYRQQVSQEDRGIVS